MNSIEFRNIKLELLKENIVLISFLKEKKINALDLEMIVKESTILTKGKKYHSIVDLTDARISFTKSAIKYYKEYSKSKKNKISQSIILKSIGSGLVGAAMLRMIKVIVPHNFFSNLDEAIEWIDESYN